MKKILALIGVLSLASGAWAAQQKYDIPYQWDVNIKDVPYASVDDIPSEFVIFLADKRVLKQEGVQAALDQSVFHFTMGDLQAFYHWDTRKDYEGEYRLEYVSLNIVRGHEGMGTYDAVAHMNLSSTMPTTELGPLRNDLVTVVYSAEKGLYLPMNATMPGEAYDFTSQGSFAQIVPEPTSGLLLLLGVAGLALRRKKAA